MLVVLFKPTVFHQLTARRENIHMYIHIYIYILSRSLSYRGQNKMAKSRFAWDQKQLTQVRDDACLSQWTHSVVHRVMVRSQVNTCSNDDFCQRRLRRTNFIEYTFFIRENGWRWYHDIEWRRLQMAFLRGRRWVEWQLRKPQIYFPWRTQHENITDTHVSAHCR